MIQIRQTTINDHEIIVALDQEVFGWYGAEEDPEIIHARLEVFAEGCAILEAQDESGNHAVVGYLTTEKWASQREPVLDENPYETHEPAGSVLNITTLAIAPSKQNRGLGKVLLDHAIEIAQREGCTHIILETARAQRFYLRHGFTVVSERQQRGIVLTVMLFEVI
ncbi:MAG: N-acetyltransferase [Chloroflexota bacterium]